MTRQKALHKPRSANPGPCNGELVALATSWALAACPRCGGSLLTYYGEMSCWNCGWSGPTTKGKPGRVPTPRFTYSPKHRQ